MVVLKKISKYFNVTIVSRTRDRNSLTWKPFWLSGWRLERRWLLDNIRRWNRHHLRLIRRRSNNGWPRCVGRSVCHHLCLNCRTRCLRCMRTRILWSKHKKISTLIKLQQFKDVILPCSTWCCWSSRRERFRRRIKYEFFSTWSTSTSSRFICITCVIVIYGIIGVNDVGRRALLMLWDVCRCLRLLIWCLHLHLVRGVRIVHNWTTLLLLTGLSLWLALLMTWY